MNTPVVLFLFKRKSALSAIFSQLRVIKPSRLYIIADGPRNDEEKQLTDAVRAQVEDEIDWKCDVVKNYAKANRGVYENIGQGAVWVFEREDTAIFLEDDNFPEISFFQYCEDLLEHYRNDDRILWVCGTNYLESYHPKDGSSYMFTQHLLPCGWASWSSKFLTSYDGNLRSLTSESLDAISTGYGDPRLFKQDKDVIRKTKKLLDTGDPMASWDRQMLFAVRANSQYGVSPTKNQIRNVGADQLSTHGGTSMKKTMTNRFCEIPTAQLDFPLVHPPRVLIDSEYEARISDIILYPLRTRLVVGLARLIKPLLGIGRDESLVLKWQRKK